MSSKQQETAFKDYIAQVQTTEMFPSEHGFIIYYGMWCAERRLTNDLTSTIPEIVL